MDVCTPPSVLLSIEFLDFLPLYPRQAFLTFGLAANCAEPLLFALACVSSSFVEALPALVI
eukprot:6200109-Pleurochrysis_carterae.AAC.1